MLSHARSLALGTLLLVWPAHARPVSAQSPEPPWRTHLMPWQTHAGQPRPWRDDPRLKGRNEPGYPDDFQVLFANPDSVHGGRPEAMWVRVIAYDRSTDLFLGILLNQPDILRSLEEGDNAVFRIDATRGFPVAVGLPDYAAAGWPPRTSGAFGMTVRAGIRAYRVGDNGHNETAIDRCITTLSPIVGAAPAGASREEQFVAHYVLGRCLAEKYETQRAINEFRAVIALDPDDADAHMALLAELSVMTHRRPGELSAAEESRWERQFTEELALVRRRFATYEGVTTVLTMVFDPALESQLDSLWTPHVAKLRRVGYTVFRWKQR